MGLLSERAKQRAAETERRERRVAPFMADAERYRPSDGVGVKADEPLPEHRYVKVTVIIEDELADTTIIVDRAEFSMGLIPQKVSKTLALDGAFYSPIPEAIAIEIRPRPKSTEQSWGTVITNTHPKEADR